MWGSSGVFPGQREQKLEVRKWVGQFLNHWLEYCQQTSQIADPPSPSTFWQGWMVLGRTVLLKTGEIILHLGGRDRTILRSLPKVLLEITHVQKWHALPNNSSGAYFLLPNVEWLQSTPPRSRSPSSSIIVNGRAMANRHSIRSQVYRKLRQTLEWVNTMGTKLNN